MHGEGLRTKKKTEMMKISREHEDLNIEVDIVRIKNVTKFKYFGMTLNSDEKKVGEIEEKIGKFSMSVG